MLRRTKGISYGSPFSITYFVEISDGHIKFIKGYDAKAVADFDDRWTEKAANKYLELLDDFYNVSNFHTFFISQQNIYEKAEQLTDSLLNMVDVSWFENVFGVKFDLETAYVCVANGGSNYCICDSSLGSYILLGGIRESYSSPTKIITYPSHFSTVIHEITHYFMNPIVMPVVIDKMKRASHEAIKRRNNAFSDVGIGVESVTDEWLVRLLVSQYLKEHSSPDKIDRYLLNETTDGFIWMHRSYDFMRHFDENRDKYKTIADFLPQLAAHYNHSILHEYDIIEREWLTKIPYVTDVFPAPDSEIDFNQDSIRFEFTFSRDMNIKVEGYRLLMRNPFAASNCNENDFRTFWLNPRKYVCIGSTDALKQIGFYGIELLSNAIQADGGYNMAKDYKVKYK